LLTAEEAGDEPVLLASSLPGVAVLVGESRAAAGRLCLETEGADLFLLDDGFQHLSLGRDLDILLVDGREPGRLTLPFGPLREGPSAARFADALVVTKCRDEEAGRSVASRFAFPRGRPVAFSRLVPSGFVARDGSPVHLPPGQEVVAFSGIAHNEDFAAALAEAGLRVRRFFPFRDHRRYSPRDLAAIAAAADGLPVVTTEKDLVRLPPELPFCPRALRVRVEFLAGWEDLAALLLERVGGGPG